MVSIFARVSKLSFLLQKGVAEHPLSSPSLLVENAIDGTSIQAYWHLKYLPRTTIPKGQEMWPPIVAIFSSVSKLSFLWQKGVTKHPSSSPSLLVENAIDQTSIQAYCHSKYLPWTTIPKGQEMWPPVVAIFCKGI